MPDDEEARLLIVEPRKGSPGQLHAFLLTTPLAVPPFFKYILTDDAHAEWLGKAVKATPDLARLTDADGRRAIDVAHPACKHQMQAALYLLARYDVEDGPLLHRSATSAVAAADDHTDPKAKPVRRALKAMREPEQVLAELQGRVGLDSKYVVAVRAVFADQEAVDHDKAAWAQIKSAAAELGIEAQFKGDLCTFVYEHLIKNQETAHPAAAVQGNPAPLERKPTQRTLDASSKYSFLLVLDLADRSLATALIHDRIDAKEYKWSLVRKIGGDLARALNHLHVNGRIHADSKPHNIVRVRQVQDTNLTTYLDWQLIDLDVSCRLDEGFGSKLPSTGYAPPEAAKVFLEATDPSTGQLVNKEALGTYKASVAYDLWSFGLVLFYLGTGKSLWHTNQDDSISRADLRKLAGWDVQQRKAALRRFNCESPTKDEAALQDLVLKLLAPSPEARLENFSSDTLTEMMQALRHPFFDWSLSRLADADAKHPGSHALGGVHDAPEGVDRLGYMIYAKALASTAREVESPKTSLCIGLYAGWGGGKSFLWTLISGTLQSHALVDNLYKLHSQACLSLPASASKEAKEKFNGLDAQAQLHVLPGAKLAKAAFDKAMEQLCNSKSGPARMVDEDKRRELNTMANELDEQWWKRGTSADNSPLGIRQLVITLARHTLPPARWYCRQPLPEWTTGYKLVATHDSLRGGTQQRNDLKAAEWHAVLVALLLLMLSPLLIVWMPLLIVLEFVFKRFSARCASTYPFEPEESLKVDLKGTLWKRSGLHGFFQERYFEMVPERAELRYLSKPGSPFKTIRWDDVTAVRRVYPAGLVLVLSSGRELHLRAADAAQRDKWYKGFPLPVAASTAVEEIDPKVDITHEKRVVALLLDEAPIGEGELHQQSVSCITMLRYAVLHMAQWTAGLISRVRTLICAPFTTDKDLPTGADKYVMVEFDAWVYHGSDLLWASLIQELHAAGAQELLVPSAAVLYPRHSAQTQTTPPLPPIGPQSSPTITLHALELLG